MPYYEHIFIARQDVSSTQVEAMTEAFEGVITENGGAVTKKESWGLKSLTYRIKKNRKGHYVLMNLDAPPAALQEMERQMRLHEDVLRYLSIKVDELDEAPSVQMQSRSSRDDRPRRRDFGSEGSGGGGGAAAPEAAPAVAPADNAADADAATPDDTARGEDL